MSLAAASIGVVLAVVVSALPSGFIFPASIVGGAFLVWSYRRPVVAVSLIILGQFLVLERTETITLAEIAFGVYFFGFLGWWFIHRLFVLRAAVCDHAADRLLMAFLAFAGLSVIPALAGGADLLSWFREYLTVATLFLYFPLRRVMNTENGRGAVFGAIGLLIVGIAVNNTVNYGIKVASANYFWELLGARQAANAHFLFPAFVALSAIAVHLDGGKRSAAVASLAVITVALLLTFARGFWVGAFAGTLVVMLLSPATIRWRMLKLSAVMLVVAGFASYVFSGGIVGRLLESVGDRMLSSGKSLGDISLRARFIESQALIDRILPSPLIGNGLGARYSFYNVLQHTTSTTTYAHNGYLYLLFKLGLAGTGLLVVWFLKLLTVAWAGSRSTTGRPFMTAMIRASAGVLCGLLIITITSNVFIERESLLIVAIIGALVVSNTVSYPDRGTPA